MDRDGLQITCSVGSGPLREPPESVFYNGQLIGIAVMRQHGFDAVSRDGTALGRFNDISAAVGALIVEHAATARKGGVATHGAH